MDDIAPVVSAVGTALGLSPGGTTLLLALLSAVAGVLLPWLRIRTQNRVLRALIEGIGEATTKGDPVRQSIKEAATGLGVERHLDTQVTKVAKILEKEAEHDSA